MAKGKTEWKACAICKDQACVNCEECGPCYGIRVEAEAKLAAAKKVNEVNNGAIIGMQKRIAELEATLKGEVIAHSKSVRVRNKKIIELAASNARLIETCENFDSEIKGNESVIDLQKAAIKRLKCENAVLHERSERLDGIEKRGIKILKEHNQKRKVRK